MTTKKTGNAELKGLTPKQSRFVEEYLIDMNATQAAIRAGYSAKTANEQAARLLANVSISDAVRLAMQSRSERTNITADRVLQEFARIGFSDMRRFTTWGPSGVSLIASSTLDPDDARCVAEVSQTVTEVGGALRFKLHDKVAALTQMAKHLGITPEMFTHKFPDLSPDERKERVLTLLKGAVKRKKAG